MGVLLVEYRDLVEGHQDHELGQLTMAVQRLLCTIGSLTH